MENKFVKFKDIFELVISSNTMRISGAVLLSVFVLIMIIGIAFIILGNNKKVKTAE